jgi:hypothetical protein
MSITNWILHLLTTRKTTATNQFTSETVTIGHTGGVPQGGVLSPILWNYFFNELIRIVSNLAHTVVAYADDLCILMASDNTYLLH